MNIDSIKNGIVIDHITAGLGMELYSLLKLDTLDCSVVIGKNVGSRQMGKKDIIKIDGEVDINLEVIGYISPDSTVNVIKNGEIAGKSHIAPPEKLVDIIKCKNPRCITTTEQDIHHVFLLSNAQKREYRCRYCEAMARK